MGKFVVIERLPENEFFYPFPNALVYSTPAEFRAHLQRALKETPAPLTPAESFALSWGGGTQRFIETVEESARIARTPTIGDELSHLLHLSLAAGNSYIGDAIKYFALESGPVSRQRWLWKERKWRRCRDPQAVVDKSVSVWPIADSSSWAERYSGEGKQSWTAIFLWLPTLPARMLAKIATSMAKIQTRNKKRSDDKRSARFRSPFRRDTEARA